MNQIMTHEEHQEPNLLMSLTYPLRLDEFNCESALSHEGNEITLIPGSSNMLASPFDSSCDDPSIFSEITQFGWRSPSFQLACPVHSGSSMSNMSLGWQAQPCTDTEVPQVQPQQREDAQDLRLEPNQGRCDNMKEVQSEVTMTSSVVNHQLVDYNAVETRVKLGAVEMQSGTTSGESTDGQEAGEYEDCLNNGKHYEPKNVHHSPNALHGTEGEKVLPERLEKCHNDTATEFQYMGNIDWTSFQYEPLPFPDGGSLNEEMNNVLVSMEIEEILNSLSHASSVHLSDVSAEAGKGDVKVGSKRKLSHSETDASSGTDAIHLKKKRCSIPTTFQNGNYHRSSSDLSTNKYDKANLISDQVEHVDMKRGSFNNFDEKCIANSHSSSINTEGNNILRNNSRGFYEGEHEKSTSLSFKCVDLRGDNPTAIEIGTAATTPALSPMLTPLDNPAFIPCPTAKTIVSPWTSASLPGSSQTTALPLLVPDTTPLSPPKTESMPIVGETSTQANMKPTRTTVKPISNTANNQFIRRTRKNPINRSNSQRKIRGQEVYQRATHLGTSGPSCTPSRFCHICTRSTRPTEVTICGNVKRGTCRKIICHRCFNGLPDASKSPRPTGIWECTHCQKTCPPRAQCFTYKRVNQNRRVDSKRTRKATLPPPITPTFRAPRQ